jgi:hypothetical protein
LFNVPPAAAVLSRPRNRRFVGMVDAFSGEPCALVRLRSLLSVSASFGETAM